MENQYAIDNIWLENTYIGGNLIWHGPEKGPLGNTWKITRPESTLGHCILFFFLMISLNFWEKKMQFWKFLFTVSRLEWILHSLYQGCVFSKISRELGFVHYIEYFTISRFTISRLGCTIITTTNYYLLFRPGYNTILY